MKTALTLFALLVLSPLNYAQCDRTISSMNLFGNDIVAPVTTGGSLFWDGRDRSLSNRKVILTP